MKWSKEARPGAICLRKRGAAIAVTTVLSRVSGVRVTRTYRNQVTSVVASLALLTAKADGQIVVGPNVRVSAAQMKYSMGEVQLAADPMDANRLLACGIVYAESENRRWTVAYVSTDRGKTWTPTLETKGFAEALDPTCALGPFKVAHHVALASYQALLPYVLTLYRSTDGGLTWPEKKQLPRGFEDIDHELLVVDATSGRYGGTVYIVAEISNPQPDTANVVNGIGVWASRNAGATFAEPVRHSAARDRWVIGVGGGVVLSDGTLAVLFGELKHYDRHHVEQTSGAESNAVLQVAISHDGAASLEPPVKVADYVVRRPALNAVEVPSLAVDPASEVFKDRLYAAWSDDRSGRSEIYLSHSSDGGRTWSEPVKVNDDLAFTNRQKGPDDFMPAIAVNKDGVVGVTWYDRRDHSDDLGWDVRFRTSFDGGETWLPSVKVSSAANTFDRRQHLLAQGWAEGSGHEGPYRKGGTIAVVAALHSRQFFAGDYAGLAADAGGTFHALWIDNRTGLQQVWTAPITVLGRGVPNGDSALAHLDDVSEMISLLVREIAFNRKTSIVAITVQLKNSSRDTIRRPLKARVVALGSQFADAVRVLGSANRQTGPGAVLDFSDVIAEPFLPDQTSRPTQLRFLLSGVPPLSLGMLGSTYPYKLVDMKLRLLGRSRTNTGGNRNE